MPADEHGSAIERAGDECYWCGSEPAEGGTIKMQLNEDEPKRETCPDCFRNWPPDEVQEGSADAR